MDEQGQFGHPRKGTGSWGGRFTWGGEGSRAEVTWTSMSCPRHVPNRRGARVVGPRNGPGRACPRCPLVTRHPTTRNHWSHPSPHPHVTCCVARTYRPLFSFFFILPKIPPQLTVGAGCKWAPPPRASIGFSWERYSTGFEVRDSVKIPESARHLGSL